jgi:hypothetical protein
VYVRVAVAIPVAVAVTVQADYAAALAKYKAATFTDSLSDEELAAAQARFNDGMKLFNRGAIEQALVIFDEVGQRTLGHHVFTVVCSYTAQRKNHKRDVQWCAIWLSLCVG